VSRLRVGGSGVTGPPPRPSAALDRSGSRSTGPRHEAEEAGTSKVKGCGLLGRLNGRDRSGRVARRLLRLRAVQVQRT
jgi:hypothetical protein